MLTLGIFSADCLALPASLYSSPVHSSVVGMLFLWTRKNRRLTNRRQMDLAEYVRSQALEKLRQGTLSHDQLNDVLRLFAKYRSQLIQNTLLKMHGARVLGG